MNKAQPDLYGGNEQQVQQPERTQITAKPAGKERRDNDRDENKTKTTVFLDAQTTWPEIDRISGVGSN